MKPESSETVGRRVSKIRGCPPGVKSFIRAFFQDLVKTLILVSDNLYQDCRGAILFVFV
jgi:hypothetical protein